MKAIVTVIGKDRVGIIALVSQLLAERGVNVLDISQTVLQDYFTMIMLVDASACTEPFAALAGKPPGESSAAIRARVLRCRAVQAARYRGLPGVRCNADLPAGQLQRHCPLEPAAETVLRAAMDELGLTARAYARILRVARTIADMAGAQTIAREHLFEAIQYRALDRAQW